MPNPLHITSENSEELLNVGAYDAGAVIRLQWSATQAGAFVDVSGTGSTPTLALVAGTRSYIGYDPNGTSSTWYRVRYENVGATRVSDWLAAFQVGGEEAGQLCSLYDIRQRLGFPASDTTQDENILEIIGQVSASIMGYTGRRFARNPSSGTTTFLYDVNRWSRTLYVPKGIAEMSQLEIASVTNGAFTVIPTTDWFLDPPATERDYGWPATRITLSNVSGWYFYPGKLVARLTMAEGWTSVPADIQAIAQRASVGAFLSKGSGASGVTLVGVTGGMTVLRNLSPADMETLTWYSHLAVA